MEGDSLQFRCTVDLSWKSRPCLFSNVCWLTDAFSCGSFSLCHLQVEAERRAHEQEENKASEEYIQKLLAEEEEEHRLAEERRKEMEEQLKQDEELAWQLSNSLNDSLGEHVLSSSSRGDSLSHESLPANLCKVKNKPSNSGDIQKYLTPKHHTLRSASFSRATEGGGTAPGFVISNNEGSSTEGQDEQEEMPTLSPQLSGVTKSSSAEDLFMQTYINFLNASASEETATVKQKNTHEPNRLRDELLHKTCGVAEGEGARTVLLTSKGEDGIVLDSDSLTHVNSINLENCAETSSCIQLAINSMSDSKSVKGDLMKMAGNADEKKPESLLNTKEAPKRKSPEALAEAVVDLGVVDKRRRTFPGTLEEEAEWKSDFNLQMQKAFEQELHERHMQEEQDRLLALQLQRQFNKEERLLNRQKGSPDEYLLRTKTPQSVKDSSRKGSSKMAKDSKLSKKQSETNHHKGRKGSCNENWQSPTRVRMKSPSSGKVLNCVVNTSDSNDVHALPKRKQKTILQMLKSPVTE
ncbi:E3 ubiquitin-protein ligase RNF168 isoform X2 [Phasianus colchicus]|uniref:E3 ubiquitin-protein ligase RNF168 isoform X2 n=1 Tax=Phasianus colchicus TaxID=9054 RepID=UPI00129EB2B6|nr:E3 ubiquitin-protein ligase RNF168 isoform X2 [Phasianus colchicus]